MAPKPLPTTDPVSESPPARHVSQIRATVTPLRRMAGVIVEDAELVRRMLGNDAWAKEAFYRKHVEQAFRVAARLLQNESDTEDVVQEAFSQAFCDLKALREPAAARVWLMRIVVHRVHRKFRKRRVLRILGLDRQISDKETRMSLVPATGASPELCAELRLVSRALEHAEIASRTAWSLRYVEGYSLPEVAEACGCSLATAKRRIAKVDQIVLALRQSTGGLG